MATARRFAVRMHEGDTLDQATLIGEAETRAWNSAARKSEELVRAFAREQGERYAGEAPVVLGKPGQPTSIYQRRWVGEKGGKVVRIYFHEMPAK